MDSTRMPAQRRSHGAIPRTARQARKTLATMIACCGSRSTRRKARKSAAGSVMPRMSRRRSSIVPGAIQARRRMRTPRPTSRRMGRTREKASSATGPSRGLAGRAVAHDGLELVERAAHRRKRLEPPGGTGPEVGRRGPAATLRLRDAQHRDRRTCPLPCRAGDAPLRRPRPSRRATRARGPWSRRPRSWPPRSSRPSARHGGCRPASWLRARWAGEAAAGGAGRARRPHGPSTGAPDARGARHAGRGRRWRGLHPSARCARGARRGRRRPRSRRDPRQRRVPGPGAPRSRGRARRRPARRAAAGDATGRRSR